MHRIKTDPDSEKCADIYINTSILIYINRIFEKRPSISLRQGFCSLKSVPLQNVTDEFFFIGQEKSVSTTEVFSKEKKTE